MERVWSGQTLADGGKCAKLSGVVTDTGGGFVSMRTRNFATPVNLAAFDGVALRVRGKAVHVETA